MKTNSWDYQQELVKTHKSKGDQCLEYGRFDDAIVHYTIAKILTEGALAKFSQEHDTARS